LHLGIFISKINRLGEKMKNLTCLLMMTSLVSLSMAHANEGPCRQIKKACENAGFVKGKEGRGLWVNCIAPIMQGTVSQNSVLPLPADDPSLVAACKQKHPKFGTRKTKK
jgi:hypothetical protein